MTEVLPGDLWKGKECRIVMKNVPSDNEYFWNKRSEVFDEQVMKVYKKAYKKTVKRSLPYLQEGDRVLEFGCGTGNTTIPLAKHVKSVVAIDTSEEMLSKAALKARENEIDNITFCHTDLKDFSGEHGSFDVVTAFNVLLYLEDRDEILEKIWKLLKPGGIFISATDCLGRNFSKDSLRKFVKTKLHLMPYVSFDTPIGLMRKIQKSGFLVLEIVNLHKNPPNIFIVAQKIERK